MSSGDYMILQPEKASLLDLLGFLFIDSNLPNYDFVDTNVTTKQETRFTERLLIVGTLVYMKFASSVSDYSATVSGVLEYALNFFSLNRGLHGFTWRSLTDSIEIPQTGNVDYRSIHSFINNPIVLNKKATLMVNYVPPNDLKIGTENQKIVELAIKASQLAYENCAYIENVVNNEWQMKFVEFFECRNLFLKGDCAYATEAFIFCDKATDPSLIVVAFRGTEPLQFADWKTDIDFSWIDTKVMGRVHVGFMKALGLQNQKNFAEGFPKDYTGTEILAYYSIRAKLTKLLTKYSNAKILVTGHSLGGALAVVFTSLLSYHNQKNILDKIEYVYNFGQPRVGDAKFGRYMAPVLGDKFRRMVYRFDLVPRIPFENTFFMKYVHFGTCVEYDGWFKGKMGTSMPDVNYFNPLYLPRIYWGYLMDFALTIWWGITKGQWEGLVGTLCRIFGVILPGIVFHNCSNYINASMYAHVTYNIKA